jgi:nitroreductase
MSWGTPAQEGKDMSEMIDLLLTRRSVVAGSMTQQGPSNAEVETILAAGHRVPDHGKLGPWRFILFEGEARAAFGSVLRDAFAKADPEAGAERADLETLRFVRVPTVIAVISHVTGHIKIPIWEQQLAAGAVCQNMLVAASALGYASQWLTEWYAYDETVADALGLGEGERVAGFIYLGGKEAQPTERVRPDLTERITRWSPE